MYDAHAKELRELQEGDLMRIKLLKPTDLPVQVMETGHSNIQSQYSTMYLFVFGEIYWWSHIQVQLQAPEADL